MKNYSIIITILFICFLLLSISNFFESRKESSIAQKTIDGLKKKNQVERDSLEKELRLTKDSLTIAFETIKVSHAESQQARERSQKTINNLRQIIFVTLNDSSRNAELTKLYPSFKNHKP